MPANPTWKGKFRAACTVLSHSPHELEDNVVHMLGLPAGALTSPESFSNCVHSTAATILYEVILGVCDVNPAISIAIAKRLEQMSPGGQGIDLFAEASTEEKLFVPDIEVTELCHEKPDLLTQNRKFVDDLEKICSLPAATIGELLVAVLKITGSQSLPRTEEVPPMLAELKLQTELLRRLARAVSPTGDALSTRISE